MSRLSGCWLTLLLKEIMKNIKKKFISLLFVLSGLFGLFLAMNENASYINLIGVSIFGLACFFGSQHASDRFHPLWWIEDKINYYIEFWRL